MALLAEKQKRWLMPSLTLKGLRDIDFTRGKGKVFLQISPLVLLIAVWWIGANLLAVPRVYPTPLMVGQKFVSIMLGESEFGSSSYVHIWTTLYRFFVAFIIAFVLGTTIGILTGRRKFLFNLFDNVGWILFSVPAVLWAFIFLIALGITNLVPILVLIALISPKVAITVAEGAKAIPYELLEMADSYKASTWQKVRDIFLPHLVPYLLASARVAFSLGVKLIIAAEVVGLPTGIGYMIKYWSDRTFVHPIIAWGLILVALAMLAEYGLFARLERRVTKWRAEPQVVQKGAE